MKTRKPLIVVLAALVASALVGCGGNGSSATANPSGSGPVETPIYARVHPIGYGEPIKQQESQSLK